VLPVAAGERTHGERHQADVRFGHWRWTERQLYEVQLTPDIDWGVSLHRRLLPCRANWRYRPTAASQVIEMRAGQLTSQQTARRVFFAVCSTSA